MTKVVLGGGLSGLSAAYYLLKRFPNSPVVVLEKQTRIGGWVNTCKEDDGTIFEAGPHTIRPIGNSAYNTLELIEELGLDKDVISINSKHPAATNRMIYVNEKLHKLPSNIPSMFIKKTPFTKPLIMSLAKDILTPPKISSTKDESIYDFVNRRFGREFADYLISPMVCGVCAGNSKEISVNFLMESLFNFEQTYGNISKGLVKSIIKEIRDPKKTIQSNLVLHAKKSQWRMYTFKNGMDILPTTLKNAIVKQGGNVETNVNCKELSLKRNKAVAVTNNGILETNHLFSCIPAYQLANLTQKEHPNLSKLLKSIPFVDTAVLNLQFKGHLLKENGFGYLVPPKENVPVLGVIFDSCYLPPSDNTILTVMLGGYWFEKYLGKNPNEKEIINIALQHMKKSMNINEVPIKIKVNILRNCIPQYIVGHKEKLGKINDYIKINNLPISLCGASYDGISVNDVILSARNAVHNM